MLIASLQKIVTKTGNVAYCATDPFDGEMLTAWHSTIMQVDHELEEKDKHWGIMLACHRGESDVTPQINEIGSHITKRELIPMVCKTCCGDKDVPDRPSKESDTGLKNEVLPFSSYSLPRGFVPLA